MRSEGPIDDSFIARDYSFQSDHGLEAIWNIVVGGGAPVFK